MCCMRYCILAKAAEGAAIRNRKLAENRSILSNKTVTKISTCSSHVSSCIHSNSHYINPPKTSAYAAILIKRDYSV